MCFLFYLLSPFHSYAYMRNAVLLFIQCSSHFFLKALRTRSCQVALFTGARNEKKSVSLSAFGCNVDDFLPAIRRTTKLVDLVNGKIIRIYIRSQCTFIEFVNVAGISQVLGFNLLTTSVQLASIYIFIHSVRSSNATTARSYYAGLNLEAI